MAFAKGFTGIGNVRSNNKEEIDILYFLLGYIPILLGFVVFVYTMVGLATVMNRIIYFLAGGDTALGLLEIRLFLLGSLISIGIFFLGLYLLFRGAPRQARSRREYALWYFGLLSSNCLLLLSTIVCLAFLIWLAFASFPLLYTGIRIGIVYIILFLVLVWRSIVHFGRFKKERSKY